MSHSTFRGGPVGASSHGLSINNTQGAGSLLARSLFVGGGSKRRGNKKRLR